MKWEDKFSFMLHFYQKITNDWRFNIFEGEGRLHFDTMLNNTLTRLISTGKKMLLTRFFYGNQEQFIITYFRNRKTFFSWICKQKKNFYSNLKRQMNLKYSAVVLKNEIPKRNWLYEIYELERCPLFRWRLRYFA